MEVVLTYTYTNKKHGKKSFQKGHFNKTSNSPYLNFNHYTQI